MLASIIGNSVAAVWSGMSSMNHLFVVKLSGVWRYNAEGSACIALTI